jgi:hypothetical protein
MGSRHSSPTPPPPPKRYVVPINDWMPYITNAFNDAKIYTQTQQDIHTTPPSTFAFLIGKDGGGTNDPAVGCQKEFISTYSCSSSPSTIKTLNIPAEAWGKTAIYDCKQEMDKCLSSKLELTDDGKLVMYHNNQQVWNYTMNEVGVPMVEYSASQSKYKRNYLLPGETLSSNEFVGSPTGTCYLLFTPSNELVLAYQVSSCEIKEQDTIVGIQGEENVGGIYSIQYSNTPSSSTSQSLQSNLGKVEYINADGERVNYPEGSIGLGTEYFNVGNYDTLGNDLTTSPINVSSVDECKIQCNQNNECYGFVFNENTHKCYLKNNKMYPYEQTRIYNPSTQLYVRSKAIQTNSTTPSCTKEVIPISADVFQSLPFANETMSSTTKCALGKATEIQQEQVEVTDKDLHGLLGNLKTELTNVSTQNHSLTNENKKYLKKLERDIKSYERILNTLTTTTKETNETKGMMEDTRLDKISNQYQMIGWVCLALFVIFLGVRYIVFNPSNTYRSTILSNPLPEMTTFTPSSS